MLLDVGHIAPGQVGSLSGRREPRTHSWQDNHGTEQNIERHQNSTINEFSLDVVMFTNHDFLLSSFCEQRPNTICTLQPTTTTGFVM